ncbi:MAG: FCD domain-containing protein [Roseibium sp.]|uniref:FCD domain-containing protein n=1 Tax=Roseibium sp. TaxID=1936156 RepID=UPI001B0C1AFF|nr:FCD domain-containing protein [Roseibium sp.]MBO6895365.1 FCD domain-containing protein [Roseibium sp.]MBO6931181.1 FCD domain-containing protein [Roseibium sp.]
MTSDDSKRRYQEIAELLARRIAEEGYKPGDKFPTERQISMEMGISRSLVREAFIVLEIEGYLDVRKGSGSYVADGEKISLNVQKSDFGPFELLQARQLLESSIAGFAATTITKNDIIRLRETLELERKAIENGTEDYLADRQFHLLIAEATQNSVLVAQVEDLWTKRENSSMWARLHDRIFDLSYRTRWLDDHAIILEALRHRDSDRARHAMWQHLENVRLTLLELSDVGDPEFDGYLYTPAVASP